MTNCNGGRVRGCDNGTATLVGLFAIYLFARQFSGFEGGCSHGGRTQGLGGVGGGVVFSIGRGVNGRVGQGLLHGFTSGGGSVTSRGRGRESIFGRRDGTVLGNERVFLVLYPFFYIFVNRPYWGRGSCYQGGYQNGVHLQYIVLRVERRYHAYGRGLQRHTGGKTGG